MVKQSDSELQTRILFITLPEHGQANVQLAVIHALQAGHPSAEVHLASFEALRSRVPPGVQFHGIPGKGLGAAFKTRLPELHKDPELFYSIMSTRPGLLGTLEGIPRMLPWALQPGTPAEYTTTTRAIEKVIEAVAADLIVVDFLFDQAADAISRSFKNVVFLSPNTFKDLVGEARDLTIFTQPMVNTAWPCPLPWFLVPLNVLLILLFGIWANQTPHFKNIKAARHVAGYTGPMPFMKQRRKPILCVSTPEIEYPCPIPSNVVPCGPILLPSEPLERVDTELTDWIAKRKTILVCLGSHIRTDEKYAVAVLNALTSILEARSDVQVLWKLQKIGSYKLAIPLELSDRIKLVEWLQPEPSSIFRHSQVICSINHGGSNSYHEALSAEVPQIILSAWLDCHDFGARLEWLGNGVWGNRYHAPRCDEQELTQALRTVIGETPDAPSAVRIRDKAQEIACTIRAYKDGKEGREVAAEYVWQEALAGAAARL